MLSFAEGAKKGRWLLAPYQQTLYWDNHPHCYCKITTRRFFCKNLLRIEIYLTSPLPALIVFCLGDTDRQPMPAQSAASANEKALIVIIKIKFNLIVYILYLFAIFPKFSFLATPLFSCCKVKCNLEPRLAPNLQTHHALECNATFRSLLFLPTCF